jgi:hypothetical protein
MFHRQGRKARCIKGLRITIKKKKKKESADRVALSFLTKPVKLHALEDMLLYELSLGAVFCIEKPEGSSPGAQPVGASPRLYLVLPS